MVGLMDHPFLPYISKLFRPPYVVGFMDQLIITLYISQLFIPPYVVGFMNQHIITLHLKII